MSKIIATYGLSPVIQLHIESIVYDVEDYIVFYEYNAQTETKGRRCKSKICFTNKGQPYFMHHKRRVYLDECIKSP